VRREPFDRSDIRREIPHSEAPDVAPDLMSIDHRAVPRPIVTHRAFHAKFAGVWVDDHKNELALRHQSSPETEANDKVRQLNTTLGYRVAP
jgi:hypothetical protein